MGNNQITIDPRAKLLTQAIGMQEGGGQINYNAKGASGESGAYQWMPNTWKLQAGQYLGDPNAQMTPENQNQVAYSWVKDQLDSGLSPVQVASKWNSGRPNAWQNNTGVNAQGVSYDTGAYVQGVQKYAEQLWNNQQQGQGGNGLIPTANAQTPGAQPATDQGPSVSGFIGNVFNSAGNLVTGLANAVTHPVKTASTLAGTLAGGAEKAFGVQNQDTQMFDNAVNYFKNRYGGDSLSQVVSNIGKTLYTDPVGAALDVSTLLDGVGAAVSGAAKVSKIAELSDAAEAIKSASSMLNPVGLAAKTAGKVASGAADLGAGVLKSAVSHATSFDTGTIENLVEHPEWFSKAAMDATSRGGVLEEVRQGLETFNDLKNETGKGYQLVEKSGQTVTLPDNFLQDILNKGTIEEDGRAVNFGYNVEPTQNGGYQVVAGTTAKHYDPRSVSAIQSFVDRWGGKTQLDPAEFLSMRREAAKLGKLGRDMGENKGAALVGRAIESQLNKYGRPQLGNITGLANGLKGLDEESAPLIRTSNKLTKDLYNTDGSLKDNSASKVANALNKAEFMKRLEQVSPGITQRLQALKAVEDIERAMGIKVGSYTRGIGEVFAASTGNIPMVVGMILSHPTIAKQILRGFGYVRNATIVPILGKVRALLGALPQDAIMTATKMGLINNTAQNQTQNQTAAPAMNTSPNQYPGTSIPSPSESSLTPQLSPK